MLVKRKKLSFYIFFIAKKRDFFRSKYSKKSFTNKAQEMAQTVNEALIGLTDFQEGQTTSASTKSAKETFADADGAARYDVSKGPKSFRQATENASWKDNSEVQTGKNAEDFGRALQEKLDETGRKSIEKMKSME